VSSEFRFSVFPKHPVHELILHESRRPVTSSWVYLTAVIRIHRAHDTSVQIVLFDGLLHESDVYIHVSILVPKRIITVEI